jgi:hypothetical protein
MRWHWLIALIVLLVCAGPTFGQSLEAQTSEPSAAPSLGDVAKKNKESAKGKAKRVVTDDDVSARSNPIPVIALQGPDNTEDILNAIHELRKTHDASEAERIVHEWFDEQSDVLSSAIEANAKLAQHTQLRMEVAQDENMYNNQYDPDRDYSKVQQRQIADRRLQRVDARNNRDNFQIITRIQQIFAKVRVDMFMAHTKSAYDWFKIRNTNGVGVY